MSKRLIAALPLALAVLMLSGCSSTPPLTEYPRFIELPKGRDALGLIPVILVGRIIGASEVGRPRGSRWYAESVQLVRVNVQVETVLQAYTVVNGVIQPGDNPSGEVSVYFYFHPAPALPGPRQLGMAGQGGGWHTGDRVMFFLQRENGYLRTVCDQWATCAIAVYTGAHPGYRPRSGDVTTSIIDILLTRGRGSSDEQMIRAIHDFRPYDMNPEYAIHTVQKVANEDSPEVRKAAREELTTLLESTCTEPPWWIKSPWAGPCEERKRTERLGPTSPPQQ